VGHTRRRRQLWGATTFLLLGLSGCGSTNVIGPDNQLEFTNATDTFQWQVSALDNVTQTLSYTWQNTGTVANVNHSSSPNSGSATVRITAADGTEVYSRSLADNGSFETTAGAAGAWTIVVTLTEVTGTLNFRVQTP
jgi:hypothetical protein